MDVKKDSNMNRREFSKQTALAGAAMAAAAGAAQARQTKSGTIKIGVLGCGGRMSADLSRMLAGNEDVKVVALADVLDDHLADFRKRFAGHKEAVIRDKMDVSDKRCFTGFNGYKDLLASDVDLVLDACTPYARVAHVEAAVEAGKHIFAEKPVAVDSAGVRRFLRAMEQHEAKGLSFVAGTQYRHDPSMRQTMEKIHNGAIGKVMALRSFYCSSFPWVVKRNPAWGEVEYRIRNWYSYNWCSGDNIVEQAIHLLDLCNWVMGGPPESVYAAGGRAWKPADPMYGDIWDHFSCDYVYPGGVHNAHYCRHWDGTDTKHGIEVVGTEGISNGHDLAEWQGDSTMQEHQDLIASIRGTGDYLHEGKRVGETTLTAIMGRMSAYTGKDITWEEAMNAEDDIVPKELSFDTPIKLGPVPVPVTKPNKPLENR